MILSIETGFGQFSVCTFVDDAVQDFYKSEELHKPAEDLLPVIEEIVHDYSTIKAIACNIGPASFTGLRIGVVTANALGFANNIPLIGVTSLQAVYKRDNVAQVAVNANRGEVYYQEFPNGKPCLKLITEFEPANPPDASDIAHVAWQKFVDQDFDKQLTPLYVRASV